MRILQLDLINYFPRLLSKLINLFLVILYNILYLRNRSFHKKIFEKKILDFLKKKPEKLIIRNDRLGDSIITLPFVLGSQDNQKYYFISKYIKEIIKDLDLAQNWKEIENFESYRYWICANLTGADINKIKEIKYLKNKLLITQFSLKNNIQTKGYPIIKTANYGSDIAQSQYIKNSFNKLKINCDPILGIKLLNQKIDLINKKQVNHNKEIIVFLGLGLDKGREISFENLNDIINFCEYNKFQLSIVEEPGFRDEFIKIKNNFQANIIKNGKISELFLRFRKATLVIGYDCGPMHIASLCTNTLIFFSHTSPNQWGINVWNKKEASDKIKDLTLQKYLNKGSNKYNWIIFKDTIRCPIHNDKRFQNVFDSINCCRLRIENMGEILKKIIYESKKNFL
tara:strand:- start:1744 stop:2937 length:1194 start_codon:yes stop_codon:yes gene_type:complete